jgi:hypothetical protein
MPLCTLFDDIAPPTDKYEIVVRRGRALVFGENFYYLAGVFSNHVDARRAAEAFVATGPKEPDVDTPVGELPPGWHRRRTDRRRSSYKWVRIVKGRAAQARVWLGEKGKSLNLGLYSFVEHGDVNEWMAHQVSRAFMRAWKPGVTVAEAIAQLRNSPRMAERVREDVIVPAWQAVLKPPTEYGRTETAAEKRAREQEQTCKATLADYAVRIADGISPTPAPASTTARRGALAAGR